MHFTSFLRWYKIEIFLYVERISQLEQTVEAAYCD